MDLKWRCHPDNEFLIIAPKGKIDAGERGNYFQRRMIELLKQHKKKIILDLSDVVYVDSWGLGVLISAFTGLRDKGFTLIVCGANQARVQDWFKHAKMNSVFLEIFEPMQEVLKKFVQEAV